MEIFGDLTRFSFAEVLALFLVVRMEITMRKFTETFAKLCEKQECTNDLIIAHLTQTVDNTGVK